MFDSTADVTGKQRLTRKCRVEIGVCLKNLVCTDLLSESDPCVVLYQRGDDGQWEERGRTEIIQNNPDPDFSTRLNVEFDPEFEDELMFRVCVPI